MSEEDYTNEEDDADYVPTKFDVYNEAKSDLDSMRDCILRDAGWEHSSSWPGGLWLWTKTLKDGRKVSLDTSTAFWFEEYCLD